MTTIFNRFSFFTLFSLISFACCLSGHSQEADSSKATPPPPPYIGTLKGDFTFVKKIIYKTHPDTSKLTDEQKSALKALSPTPDIQELDAVQTGVLRRDRQILVDGTNLEIWRSGMNRFLVSMVNPNYIEVVGVAPDGYQDMPDFQELNWITASSFQGEQVFQGKKCYIYKSGNQEAWIDQSNRLPLSFQSNAMQVSYTYGSPDEQLQLPDKIVKRLQQVSRASAGLPPN